MSKTKTLTAGTVLYHGTDALEEFLIPRGPAWFAWDWQSAAKWAGWGSKARGQRRVIQARLTAPLEVQDTSICEDWRELCYRLIGDEDATPWNMAKAVAENDLGGWYGRAEILLVDVSLLEQVSVRNVPDDIVPWGR